MPGASRFGSSTPNAPRSTETTGTSSGSGENAKVWTSWISARKITAPSAPAMPPAHRNGEHEHVSLELLGAPSRAFAGFLALPRDGCHGHIPIRSVRFGALSGGIPMAPVSMRKRLIPALSVVALLGIGVSPAGAVFIGNSQGGTDFPQGAVSFADEVVSYDPLGGPSAANQGASQSLGLPDYVSGGGCIDLAACTFVSLGDGGSITLRFTDNVLTGSDNADLDLWIFEVGPDVEDTFVELSADGTGWTAVGKVFGSTAGIDIDAFGFGTSSAFAFVRLTDDGGEGDQSGISVGADIDAVGAISTRPVPEPGTFALLALGAAALSARRRVHSRA